MHVHVEVASEPRVPSHPKVQIWDGAERSKRHTKQS